MRKGGRSCVKYLKRGGTEKKEGETKISKRGKVGQGVSALKRGWNPLMKYGLGESVKKGKILTKIFFQIMFNKVLKSCKNVVY